MPELATLVAFLLAHECAYVNGEVIAIDGDQWLNNAGSQGAVALMVIEVFMRASGMSVMELSPWEVALDPVPGFAPQPRVSTAWGGLAPRPAQQLAAAIGAGGGHGLGAAGAEGALEAANVGLGLIA